MRWKFCDPNNAGDLVARGQTQDRIDRWWEDFFRDRHRIEQLFAREAEWDLADWMTANLKAIHPLFMWEYGPAVSGSGHRLVITPESNRFLRPLTETILEQAPQFDGWEFYGYRLAEPVEMVQPTIDARVGTDITDYLVEVQLGEMNLVHLRFYAPDITGPDDRTANHAAFVITETLLGEEMLDTWIGGVDVARLKPTSGLRTLYGGKQAPKGLIPLERLRDTVEAVIGSLYDQMPDMPHYLLVDEAEWTTWKLTPNRADEKLNDESTDDYTAREDLLVASSSVHQLFKATHSGVLVDSRRFSRVGETFCYVKLDGSEGLDEEGFADRGEIEDALNEALQPAQLGCHIGGGTGLRYSYVDLALTDIDRALPVVREVLQDGRVPHRSWIQFFDSNWCGEWVGIYGDSPPPPMPEFEA